MGPVWQNTIQRTVRLRTAHLSVIMTVHSFSTQYETYSSDNFPSYLQTDIIAQMLSIAGAGARTNGRVTRSPAVARDGRPYWPSRKTVIPPGIGLAAVLGIGQLSSLVKLIVHWLTAYCPSTLYRATLAVINNVILLYYNACLLTCDTSRNSDQHPQFIRSHRTRLGYYNFGRRLSRYVVQTKKHLQFI